MGIGPPKGVQILAASQRMDSDKVALLLGVKADAPPIKGDPTALSAPVLVIDVDP